MSAEKLKRSPDLKREVRGYGRQRFGALESGELRRRDDAFGLLGARVTRFDEAAHSGTVGRAPESGGPAVTTFAIASTVRPQPA